LDGNYTKPGEYVAYSEPKGKDLDNLFQTAIYGYVEQFGAAGFIYINHSYGGLPPTGVARWGLIGKIPACGVSRETSQMIVNLPSADLITTIAEPLWIMRVTEFEPSSFVIKKVCVVRGSLNQQKRKQSLATVCLFDADGSTEQFVNLRKQLRDLLAPVKK
jgi:hypothetical protein